MQIIDVKTTQVVKYDYGTKGKVLDQIGSIGQLEVSYSPSKVLFRRYVYDVETGLYYLRSRYYHPGIGRFLNADSLTKGNLFRYCLNAPINSLDDSGKDTKFFFSYGYPITDSVLKANEFGEHTIDEKIPMQYLISALIQMTNDPNIGGKAWKYNKTLYYGEADCNGIVRMIHKTFYSCSAYSSLQLGTLVESVVAALQLSEPIPIEDPEKVPVGCILISKDYSHMAVVIGPYQDSKNAIVESAVRYGKVRVSQDWTVGEGSRQFYYYCYMKTVDYNTSYSHTGAIYHTLEED